MLWPAVELRQLADNRQAGIGIEAELFAQLDQSPRDRMIEDALG